MSVITKNGINVKRREEVEVPVISLMPSLGTALIQLLTQLLVPLRSLYSTMGLFSKLLKTTVAGSVASVGVFWGATRNDIFQPMDTSDPIFQSAFFNKFNPSRNPTLHDVCVRRIPLDKIQSSLVEDNGKLVEAFCAGVWGGLGELSIHATYSNTTIINIFFFGFSQDTSLREPFLTENIEALKPPVIFGIDLTSSRTNMK